MSAVFHLTAVTALVPDVAEAELRDWIARGWVVPGGNPPDYVFAEPDISRIRVVRALRHEADVAADHLALVLSLLDRMATLRTRLAELDRAVAAQPAAVRAAIEATLRG